MATLHVTLGVRELSDVTLDSWFIFLKTLDPRDALAHAGPTSASLTSFWKSLSPHGRDVASNILRYLVLDVGNDTDPDLLFDVVDLSCIGALSDVQHRLQTIRRSWSVEDRLHRLLERVSSDSLTVTLQALKEIKSLLDEQSDFFQSGTSGDSFNALIGRTLRTLSLVAGRDVDGIEDIRLIAFECIGAIGALDPDRLDLGMGDSRPIVLKDFTEEEESIRFAMHLIKDVLVSAFRSTSDMGYQTNLAYAIQEMLKFCQFDPSLMASGRYTTSASLKARERWDSLPKHVLETITPLLESRYTIREKPLPAFELPIYPQHGTYREWLQQWTTCLISEAKGVAQKVFQPFRSVVRNKDVGVAHHLLAHLVLHALVSGDEDKMWNIRSEILAVLQDQVNEGTTSSTDKKLLSAQVKLCYRTTGGSLANLFSRSFLCCWTTSINGLALHERSWAIRRAKRSAHEETALVALNSSQELIRYCRALTKTLWQRRLFSAKRMLGH
jgi:serine/threonine-protein kinase ATR